MAGDRRALGLIGVAYEAAIPATIAAFQLDPKPDISAYAIDAYAAISRFDAELSQLLGAGTEFAPLLPVLLRTESASSSLIENITVSPRALAQAELGIYRRGSNAQLVVANIAAMNRAISHVSELTPQTILEIHEMLMRDQAEALPGRFRTS